MKKSIKNVLILFFLGVSFVMQAGDAATDRELLKNRFLKNTSRRYFPCIECKNQKWVILPWQMCSPCLYQAFYSCAIKKGEACSKCGLQNAYGITHLCEKAIQESLAEAEKVLLKFPEQPLVEEPEMSVETLIEVGQVQEKGSEQVREQVELYICSTCDKSFFKHSSLKNHQIMHTPNASVVYRCSVYPCQRYFKKKEGLELHKQLKHSGLSATQ